MRDLDTEDNVRKRPFSNKFSTRHPFGPFESAAKIQLNSTRTKKTADFYVFILVFFVTLRDFCKFVVKLKRLANDIDKQELITGKD